MPPDRLVMTNPVTPEGRVYTPDEQVHAFPLRAGRVFSEVLACWLPAWRAARTDPLVALHGD